MAVRRTGTVVDKALVAPGLMRFRLMPENGNPFAGYEAGQHIALRREDCKLTRKLGTGQDGKPVYEPECDPWGRQTVGPVTHAYSIASAPADTAEHGWLEFLVGFEHGVYGLPGRLNEALFGMVEEPSCEVLYDDSISRLMNFDGLCGTDRSRYTSRSSTRSSANSPSSWFVSWSSIFCIWAMVGKSMVMGSLIPGFTRMVPLTPISG